MHACARCGEPAPERRSYCDDCEDFFSRPQHEPLPEVQLRDLLKEFRVLQARLSGTTEPADRRRLRDLLVRNRESRDRLEAEIARAGGDWGAAAPAQPEEE